jgi:2-oxoglutarate ferredoxin oxidoreductase subunit gamma
VVNSSLVRTRSRREDITVAYVPANDLAFELGNAKMANVVLLGALLEIRPVVRMESVERALEEHTPERRRHIVEPNKRALARGARYIREGK